VFFARKSSPRTCPDRSSFAAVAKTSGAFARQQSLPPPPSPPKASEGSLLLRSHAEPLYSCTIIDVRLRCVLVRERGRRRGLVDRLEKINPLRPTELPAALVSNASSAKRLLSCGESAHPTSPLRKGYLQDALFAGNKDVPSAHRESRDLPFLSPANKVSAASKVHGERGARVASRTFLRKIRLWWPVWNQ
jgi:hypothetical protein